MGKLILKAIIDNDPARAEATIQSFQSAWETATPSHDAKLKFVHFREVLFSKNLTFYQKVILRKSVNLR